MVNPLKKYFTKQNFWSNLARSTHLPQVRSCMLVRSLVRSCKIVQDLLWHLTLCVENIRSCVASYIICGICVAYLWVLDVRARSCVASYIIRGVCVAYVWILHVHAGPSWYDIASAFPMRSCRTQLNNIVYIPCVFAYVGLRGAPKKFLASV